MKLILISGKKRTGKSTLQKALFKYFYDQENCFPLEINFADEIYRMHDYALKKMKELGQEYRQPKHRKLLQFLGTEWARETFGENVWCDVLKKKVEIATKNNYTHVIVSDCRFKNEFDYFPEALRVRLVAEAFVRKQRSTELWNEESEKHQSETDLDLYALGNKFDMVLSTDVYTVDECVNLIARRLESNWVKDRR